MSGDRVLVGHKGSVSSLAVLSPTLLASGSYDDTILVWNVSVSGVGAAGPVLTLRTPSDVNCLLALTAGGGGLLASGGADKLVKTWDTASASPVVTFVGHGAAVVSLAALPDGRVASGSADRTVRLWDPRTAVCGQTLPAHDGAVLGLAAAADGVLASAGSANVALWDVRRAVTSPACVLLRGHTGLVNCLSARGAGGVVSGSEDGDIRGWDAGGGSLGVLTGHTAAVLSLCALPNGTVISGGDDRAVRVWSAAAGAAVATLTGHSGAVWGVAGLPNGGVASCGADMTVRLWGVHTGPVARTGLAAMPSSSWPPPASSSVGVACSMLGAGAPVAAQFTHGSQIERQQSAGPVHQLDLASMPPYYGSARAIPAAAYDDDPGANAAITYHARNASTAYSADEEPGLPGGVAQP